MFKNCSIFVLILFVLFSISKINAKNSKPLGIIGGMNLANVYGKDVEDNSAKAGMAIGFYVNYKIYKTLTYQPEIIFSMKGYNYKTNNKIVDGNETRHFEYEGSWSLAYMEINNLININIPRKSDIKPKIYFGPSFSLNISARHKMTETYRRDVNNVIISRSEFTYSEKIENFNRVDVGAIIGLDFEIEHLSMGIRYNLGLLKLINKDANQNIKNQVISLMFGYSFH